MKRFAKIAVIAIAVATFLSPVRQTSANAATSTGVGVVTSNLLMYYDLGNPNGLSSTTLTDLSGNLGNGTLIQSSGLPSLDTNNGRFLTFTTSGGYVDLPDIVSASSWTGLTISFYANFGATQNSFERIMDFGTWGGGLDNIEVGRDFTTNALFVEVWNNTTSGGYCRSGSGAYNTNVSAANAIGVNTWNHWAITIGGGYCTVYKDNVQVNQIAYTTLPRAATMNSNFLGKSNWNDPLLEGGIADFAMYNRVLNSTELTQNYNAQTDIAVPTVSGGGVSPNENQTTAATITSSQTGSNFSIIGGNDSGKFNINATTGVLTFKTSPNYEAPDDYGLDRIYDVTIRVIDPNGNFTDYVTTIGLTNLNESTSLSTPTLSGTPYKGISVTITVTPTGDGTAIPGKITYLMAGKRIVGCYKKSYSGTGSATCTWKPTTLGNREISVTFTPTNTSFTASNISNKFFVNRRTTTR